MARLKATLTPDRPILTPEVCAQWQQLRLTEVDSVKVHTGTVEDLAASASAVFVRNGGKGYADDNVQWAHGTFRGVLNCVAAGWPEGVAMVDGLYARLITKRTESMIPTLMYSDEADGEVDTEAWLAGDDECYIVTAPSPLTVNVAGTFATVVYDPFASCGQTAADVIRRGVYVAALVYVMERAGYRVAVRMRMPNSEYSRPWLLDLSMKAHETPLDLPRFVFWLGHPGVIRQLILTMYSQYRSDGVSPRRDPVPESHYIVTPQFTYDLQLDQWLADTLQANGLHFQVGD